MAEAAGVALGVAALFDTCIEGFKIVFAAQEFAKDFEVLSASFQQQRLRFLLWGESVGLVSRQGSTSRPYLEELDSGHVRPTILQSLASIQYLLRQFKIYESRYGLKNDATLSLVNVSGLRAIDNRFVVQTRRNQKQKSLKIVTRWAVFDAEKTKETVERLKSLVDGLVDVTDQLARLRTKTHRTDDRHPGLTSMTSGIHIFETGNVRAIENNDTLSICSRQIQALDLQSSVDTFFSAQSFATHTTHPIAEQEEEVNTLGMDEIRSLAPDLMLRSSDSVDTYASTDTASDVSDLDPISLPWPTSTLQTTVETLPSPWLVTDMLVSVPATFNDFYPCRNPIYISHDNTTLDGNMNLRVFARADKTTFISLFHLRMHDIRTREFSFRRYCRESGREVCHSIMKYQKAPSSSERYQKSKLSFLKLHKRNSTAGSTHSEKSNQDGRSDTRISTLRESRTSSSSWFRRRSSRSSQVSGASGDDTTDHEGGDDIVHVAATRVSTNKIKIEFSNYSIVEVTRRGTRNGKRYTFEHWGDEYEWKRRTRKCEVGLNSPWCHSFYLFKARNKVPIASLEPNGDVNVCKEDQERGGWVPPYEMRLLDDSIVESNTDISDVVVATGVVALVDNAIRVKFARPKSIFPVNIL